MFNVLTKDLKTNIEREYKGRKLYMWLVILIFICVYLTFILIPSFIFVISEKKSVDTISDSIKNSNNSKEDEQTKKIFNDTNKFLEFINTNKSTVYTGDILSKIIFLKNNGIRLTDVIYQKQTATTSVFTLKGFAINRDSLISFSKNISSDPVFKDINLPVSNFTKDKNIEFSFDINVSL